MATRIEELASNGTLYYRGDECLEIAPFDNYYMFTVYKESPDINKVDESVPLDLTHIGFIYLLFPDGENEIRIPNYTEATNVDMVNGQVVFRIDKATAKKILATAGNIFYITAQMTDGKTAGDETVLYTGRFVDFATGMTNSLTNTVASLKSTINELKLQIDENTAKYNGEIEIANEKIKSLEATIAANEKTIKELQDTIDAYDSDVVDYIKANIVSTDYWNKNSQSKDSRISATTSISVASATTSAVEDVSKQQQVFR